MKAARWHGRTDVRIDDVDEPQIHNSQDVLVEVDLAMICGSDLAEWRDGPHVIPAARPHVMTGRTAPVTMGHEYVGRVIATGPAVTDIAVGERVCGDSCLRCNRCYWCLRGEYNICERGASVGLHADGAFAPSMVVPDYALVHVPAAVSDRHAATAEPLAVALHALRQTQMSAGDSVLVQGFGMIGAAAAMLARALGASKVIVAEKSVHRAELAATLGADLVLGPDEQDIRKSVRGETQGRGADIVLECTGRGDAIAAAIDFARRGGRIGVCGIPHEPSSIRLDRIVYFERDVVGCLGYRFDHEGVLGLLANGRLSGLDLIYGEPIALARIVPDGLARMATDPAVPLRIPVKVR